MKRARIDGDEATVQLAIEHNIYLETQLRRAVAELERRKTVYFVRWFERDVSWYYQAFSSVEAAAHYFRLVYPTKALFEERCNPVEEVSTFEDGYPHPCIWKSDTDPTTPGATRGDPSYRVLHGNGEFRGFGHPQLFDPWDPNFVDPFLEVGEV